MTITWSHSPQLRLTQLLTSNRRFYLPTYRRLFATNRAEGPGRQADRQTDRDRQIQCTRERESIPRHAFKGRYTHRKRRPFQPLHSISFCLLFLGARKNIVTLHESCIIVCRCFTLGNALLRITSMYTYLYES
jgi:hypothetical protein